MLKLKEVSDILRKFPKSRLNDKPFNRFTKEDFEEVLRLKNGEKVIHNIQYPKVKSVAVVLRKADEVLKFDSIGEVIQFFKVRAKNYWRRDVIRLGYRIESETVVYRPFQIDRKKIIETVKNNYKLEELAVMTDFELYSL